MVEIKCVRCGHVSREVHGVYDRNGERVRGFHWDGTRCKEVPHAP